MKNLEVLKKLNCPLFNGVLNLQLTITKDFFLEKCTVCV